ncbi:transglycosylase SLT domain-containing protein [Enterococcus faecium]|nr:transglycosylase SLT domain-containing protein [Enterococcus faecium]
MSADATINIDVMLSNLPNFKNDVSFVNEVLNKLGMNTGAKMDDSFKNETKKVEDTAKLTKKVIDETISKPVKMKADSTEFEEKAEKVKRQVVRFPKELKTKIIADAKGQGIEDFEKLLKKIPYEKKVELKSKATAGEAIDYKKLIEIIPSKKETKIEADASQAKTETRELGETAEKTESKFVSLKDKLTIGAVAGATSQAVQVITGSFTDLIGEGLAASDSMDKFRSTMKLGGFGEEEIDKAAVAVKKYADDTVYELDDVSNTTAQLAANGIKNYTELTQAAGNLNAQAGGNADTFKSVAMVMTQTAGAGKLTTENWNQLADAIPGASGVIQEALKKNKAFTGNFRDAMSDGQITAKKFNDAITELGMNDGAVKAAKSTSTFEGAVGNLQANVVSGIMDIINHLGKDNLTGMINKTSDAVVGVFQNIADVFLYFQKHEDTLTNISNNVKKIVGALFSGVWKEGKELLFEVAKMLGLIDDNAKVAKDPLELINEIIGKLAKHKDEIENFGKALVVMFTVKKGYEFITMLKEARKTLLELTAVEKVTDFLSGGGFSLGKKSGGKSIATAGEDIIEDVLPKGGAKAAFEAVEDVAKTGVLSKLGSLGKSGSLKLISGIGKIAKIVPYIDILSSAAELFGKGSIGTKLGGFGGSLGGTAGGATAGAAIGSLVPGIGTGIGGAIGAAVGSISGTEIGKKLGKQIEKGLKEKKIDLDDIFKGDPSKKKFFKTYKSELEQLMKDTKSSEKSYEKLSSAIDKYFRQKEKNSKDDLNTLLKNGDITKKEYNKFLKEDKRKNNTQKKNLKDNLKQMSQENERYNKEVTAINDKWDKKKNEQLSASAKTYGKNSKKYKEQEKQVTAQIEKERNKELLKARKGHEEKMTILSENTNKMVISDLKISKGKQLDLLDDLKKNTKRISREKMKEVIQTSAKERDAQIKDANKAYKETVNSAEKKRNEVVDAADREYYDNHSITKKQHDDIVKKANDTYNSTKKTAKEQRDAIVKQARDTHKSVVNEATKQAGEHKGAVDAETGEVITSWTKMKNNLRGIVNGIVDGINVLLNGLHKGWGKIPKWGAHAKGSSGLTEDEIALVGEEGFELAHHPSKGIFPVGVSGPEIRPLQAGTSILPHHMSKEFLAMTKGLPAHKDGVWGTITNMFDWVKDKAKDVWSFVSDGAGKAYDTIADKLGVSDFLDNLGDSAEYKVAAGGISNIKDKIIEYAQNFFDKFNEENGGGSFDGAMADNVYKYLVDIANQAVRKFGMSGITSGYRPGDPYWHGKHQAIDIAYPSSMNGSSKYFDPANWVFENFADKVGYVITQGKVRDRTGQSGQPATGAWEPWPDNDHYDHLHITGKLGSGDIFKAGGGSSPAGSGAERWRSQVIEAAKMVGFPTDKGHIDRIISQIQTESGGNEKAVQGGYTDINTITGDLAKGLMQTISATFNAYKMPGHGNIFNGYDNILAGLRYIMARYGTGAGFFANIGMGHGYADGGEINGPELAWIGEDPAYPKEFMINPAKPSADDLIIKAIRSREQFRPASANNVSSNSSGFLTSEISESSLQKLSQALNNRPVKVISHLDGKKVSQSVDEYTGSSLARKLYTRGKNFNGR